MLTDKMDFSQVAKHPLWVPNDKDGVLDYFRVVEPDQLLARYLPLENRNTYKVQLDVDKAERGGMTPMVAMGSSTPLYESEGRSELEWEAMEWREKVRITEMELHDYRKLGTVSDYETARDKLARKTRAIQARLARRLEWMRRQALFDGQVTGTDKNGNTVSVDYQHPDHLNSSVQASTSWDNAAADPIGDLQLWVEEYELMTDYRVAEVVMAHGTLRLLTANQTFLDIAENSHGAMNGSKEAIRGLLADHVGLSAMVESNAKHGFSTEITADVTAADTTVTVKHAEWAGAGDIVILKNDNGVTEKAEIASVSGNTITLTAGVSNDFDAGSMLKYSVFTIPRDRILLVGAPEGQVSMEGSSGRGNSEFYNDWGMVVSTLSHYEDLNNPKPGIFRKTRNMLDGDPPSMESIIGIRALPLILYSDGWMAPTITY